MNTQSLKNLLDTLFGTYITIQHYHWNIEGENFGEYHDFFGDLYGFAYQHLDTVAEQIRTFDEKVILSNLRFGIEPNVDKHSMMANCLVMFERLKADTIRADDDAVNAGEIGLVSYLEDLVDQLSKKIWMIRSYTR